LNNRNKRLIVQIFSLLLVAALVIGIFVGFFQMRDVEKQIEKMEEYSDNELNN